MGEVLLPLQHQNGTKRRKLGRGGKAGDTAANDQEIVGHDAVILATAHRVARPFPTRHAAKCEKARHKGGPFLDQWPEDHFGMSPLMPST
ncbi:hypothetical protein GCM10011452_31200 [Gemmobacter lanyuensis]|uniref:Uncharacterized protein n=1 Tax=Gemmobacter lanyuensis TaxID=1054497 RepID=A0A918MMD6_9RHOB|nr:hypothetical protein GCM10011452_31200 [Gemmobacter lanyuensis]